MFNPRKFVGSLLFFMLIGLWFTAILVDLDLTNWETYVSGACLMGWAVAIYLAARRTDEALVEVEKKWEDVLHSTDIEGFFSLTE